MPLGNKDPRDSFHEKLESLASQEFPTYFCQVQIQTKHFKTKYLTKDIFFNPKGGGGGLKVPAGYG